VAYWYFSLILTYPIFATIFEVVFFGESFFHTLKNSYINLAAFLLVYAGLVMFMLGFIVVHISPIFFLLNFILASLGYFALVFFRTFIHTEEHDLFASPEKQ
jgi:hypothetical protein